jgi:dihydrofolate reductase / thymidylate synthase
MVFNDFESAMSSLSNDDRVNEIFVIGGATIYEEAMKNPNCKLVLATRVNKTFECDTFMTSINSNFEPIHISETYS